MTPPAPVVFLGTPAAAVTVLDAVVGAGHPVALVVTRADARRGRGGKTSPSPVKQRATELGLPVTDSLEDLMEADLPEGCTGVVVAYGRIIPGAVLRRVPMLNVHFSLLPRWRGAAPVERAILAGDTETGVCIMEMEEGLDTGPVRASRRTAITDRSTTSSLTHELAVTGGALMCEVLAGAHPVAVPQGGGHTYARKIEPADLVIDWREPADVTLRRVRAVNAHTTVAGRRLRVLGAERTEGANAAGVMTDGAVVGTGDGCIRLVTVQPEARSAMSAPDWLRGANLELPCVLGG